ncbi:ArsR family transcriptional regulator [Deinococcus altitudinis]|uniref:ArsR family transcriptional regulator n=1 Tax=Deinococcus altitudinis TaxID=468914 RepID=UPI003892BE4C
MPPRLTELRLHLLRTIQRLTQTHGGLPSAAELTRHLKLSEATVSVHLRVLRDLGYLERSGARGRLVLCDRALTLIGTGIPIYGQIVTGPPILAEQNPDRATPSFDTLLGVREGDFLLEVEGDSMTGMLSAFAQGERPGLPLSELLADTGGLVLLTGARRGFPTLLGAARRLNDLEALLNTLKRAFPGRLYLQLYHDFHPGMRRTLGFLRAFSRDQSRPAWPPRRSVWPTPASTRCSTR